MQELFFTRASMPATFRALVKASKGARDPLHHVAVMLLRHPLQLSVCEHGLVPFDAVEVMACVPFRAMSLPQLHFMRDIVTDMHHKRQYVGWSSMRVSFTVLYSHDPMREHGAAPEDEAPADEDKADAPDRPEPSPPPKDNTGAAVDVFADPVAVVVEACRVAHRHYGKLGFVSAEEAERFVVARICASAVVPPQVLAEASEALAGTHVPAPSVQ